MAISKRKTKTKRGAEAAAEGMKIGISQRQHQSTDGSSSGAEQNNASPARNSGSNGTASRASGDHNHNNHPNNGGNHNRKRVKPRRLKGLTIVPPNHQEEEALWVIAELDKIFRCDAVRTKMDEKCLEGNSGVRKIQGGRYEIFVQVSNKFHSTAFFDEIGQWMLDRNHQQPQETARTVDDVRRLLLQYSQQQAREVPFIAGRGYVFDNFSLLVSHGKSESQHVHIDLQAPNVQCALVLSDGAPPTRVFHAVNSIRTAEDLQRYAWKTLPATLRDAVGGNPAAARLLRQFGDCLHPQPTEFPPEPSVEQGSLLGLEGSRLHAGPASDDHRCILFFSGWQPGSPVRSYDPDTQYYAPLIVSDWLSTLYDELGETDRRYLMDRLAKMVPLYPNVHTHYDEGTVMGNFLKALETKKYGPGGKDRLLRALAQSMDDLAPSSHWACVSAPGLRTQLGPKTYEITVYKYRETATARRGVSQQQRGGRHRHPVRVLWDGLPDGYYAAYQLELRPGGGPRRDGQLFDGRNGTLVAKVAGRGGNKSSNNEGKEIACFVA